MQNGTINRELARDRVYEYVRKQHSGQLREKGGHACVYVCIHACMHACMHLHGTKTATFKHATRWKRKKRATLCRTFFAFIIFNGGFVSA